MKERINKYLGWSILAVFASCSLWVSNGMPALGFHRASPHVTRSLTFATGLPRQGRWIEIVDGDSTTVWIDSVTLVGARTDSLTGWLMWSFAKPRNAEFGKGYVTEKSHFVMNCIAQTIGYDTQVTYDSAGVVVGTSGDILPQRVIPESVGETIASQMCQDAPAPRVK